MIPRIKHCDAACQIPPHLSRRHSGVRIIFIPVFWARLQLQRSYEIVLSTHLLILGQTRKMHLIICRDLWPIQWKARHDPTISTLIPVVTSYFS